ncbi:MAG: hypothetical protein Q8897_01190 [Sweet potato little leaf phytoplasma]|uniref:Uncharacterized protein n=4 Tax=Candidatus Phytoplasma TaxID=33926 RepID=A0A9K3STP6_9MOLU|nr:MULTISPECIES: hypothetical protein [Phytoplasma]QLL36959.1 hypothetical protein EPWB_v2c3700 ['Echinacea purpurea' witches'-broom phytoplasma]WEX20324.1 MAG: hypothetical protein TB2022_2310 [Candidatus Phytoplasma aurantifolia]EMR14722.1 hypothetical protein PNWB_v1c1200 [Peanut witches'-broom phytoplasma NTU2011]MDO7987142.1 hypothetical protein [Sweet potato little leaf phytoplasma]MDO8005578.1 hypothetical protein [Sweet potato little leaf phytoplasma]
MFALPNYIIYIICIIIIISVLFSSETDVTDVFAEQYGTFKSNKSIDKFNRFISVLILILFLQLFMQQSIL